MYQYRTELTSDHRAIEALQFRAFDQDASIPELLKSLRAQVGVYPTTSIVATDEKGQLVGHVMISHSWLDAPARMIDVMVLSPLGVDPDHQRKGIGTTLVKKAITATKKLNCPLLFLEGDPNYYGSRGFAPAEAIGCRRPSLRIPPAAFQVATLDTYTDDMSGTLIYRDSFWKHDCVGLRKES